MQEVIFFYFFLQNIFCFLHIVIFIFLQNQIYRKKQKIQQGFEFLAIKPRATLRYFLKQNQFLGLEVRISD